MPTRKEIMLKAENNRQAIFDAIGNEVMKLPEIDNILNLGEALIKNHLNTLAARGHIISTKIINKTTGKWNNLYRQSDKPYIAKTEDELGVSDQERKEYTKRFASDLEAMKANPNLRIIRRLDKRVEVSKLSSKSSYRGIGSSFSMWESA